MKAPSPEDWQAWSQSSALGLVRVDSENQVVWANPAAEALLPGLSPGQAWAELARRLPASCRRLEEGSWRLLDPQGHSGSLLSRAAHDLRNDLGTLLGFSELLLDGGLPDEKARMYQRIVVHRARRMSDRVDALLDISRFETGRSLALQPRRLILNRLLDEETAFFRTVYPDAQLDTDLGPESLTLNADPRRLRTVLRELIENALHFGGPSARVLVQARRRDTQVQLSITDEGGGILPVNQEHLFEPFFSAEGPRGQPKGTGLGLAHARVLVLASGGQFALESRWGEGTTVTLLLPGR